MGGDPEELEVLPDLRGKKVEKIMSNLEKLELERQRFEAWITSSPCERSVARWGSDERKFAWVNQYQDIAVQLAWEARCQGLRMEM